jgi:phosphoethanolamine N-methyltransferase
LESVGFQNVDAQDATEKFVECLKKELVRIESIKDDFIRVCLFIFFFFVFNLIFCLFLKEFSSEDYQHLIEGWHGKLQRCAKGDQRWGVFRARK